MDCLPNSASLVSRFSSAIAGVVFRLVGDIGCGSDSRDACTRCEAVPVGWRARSRNHDCRNGVLFVSLRRLASIETDFLVPGDALTLTWGGPILLHGVLALRCAQEQLWQKCRRRVSVDRLKQPPKLQDRLSAKRCCRNILIALKIPEKGERKARACENACSQHLRFRVL